MRALRALRTLLPWGLAAAAGFYLVREFRAVDVVGILRGAHAGWILGPGLASLAAYLLVRGVRWWLLLHAYGVPAPFVSTYLGAIAALGAGAFTPLQSGELAKAEVVDPVREGSRAGAYAAVLFEKVLDLGVLLTVAAVTWVSSWFVAAALVACACIVVAAVRAGPDLLRRTGLVTEEAVRRLASATTVRAVVPALFLTIASWCLVCCLWASLLRAVGIRLGGFGAAQLVSTVTLASVLSFVPAGVGIADAGAVVSLRHLGFNLAQAQAGAVVLRLAGIGLLLLGLLHGVALGFLRRSARSRKASGVPELGRRHESVAAVREEELRERRDR